MTEPQMGMAEQLRQIIYKTFAASQPKNATERHNVYETVRRRLRAFAARREPPITDHQKSLIFATLERIITETEERFPPEPFEAPITRTCSLEQGVSEMNTEQTEGAKSKSKKSRTRNTALIAGVAVAISAIGGWYWRSPQGINCAAGTEAAVPQHLHNIIDTPEGFVVTGADPRIVLAVPVAPPNTRICLRVQLTSPTEDILEIFLPEPESQEDKFVADRSIKKQFPSGENDISIEIPIYTANRIIRLDPGHGRKNTDTIVSKINFGKF